MSGFPLNTLTLTIRLLFSFISYLINCTYTYHCSFKLIYT
jgi:hypothetical protein